MNFDGSKLKVEIRTVSCEYEIRILEQPDSWRGLHHIFRASNSWNIESSSYPQISSLSLTFWIRGGGLGGRDKDWMRLTKDRFKPLLQCLQEFGANIVGNVACNDHTWETILEGTLYEGCFCNKCGVKENE